MSRIKALPLLYKREGTGGTNSQHAPQATTEEPTKATTTMANNLPQPDFNAITQSVQVLATEMANMANLPAVQGGNAVLDAIQTLSNNMDNRLTAIDRHLNDLDTRIDNLSTRFDANSNNTFAFVMNTHVREETAALMPFHHAITNEEIPDFPENIAAINRLSFVQLNSILADLGVTPAANRIEKTKQLRHKIGLPRVW